MGNAILQYSLYVGILVIFAIPLGYYIGKVMNGERVFLSKILVPVENVIYKCMGINKDEEMSFKKYSSSILIFSGIGFIFLFLLNLLQNFLPLNPENISATSWHLAFNTASSFVSNTNWQAYSGESALSYLTQMLGLTVQNFVSAATGIAVLFALIRGFNKVNSSGLGNFWADLTKIVLYILMPLSIVVSITIASQGIPQSFSKYETIDLIEPITLDDGKTITKQVVPLGPAASQIAIKQLGTNGGGFFGTNSAHPFENPTPFSNMVQMLSILLIPMALCFTFGRNIKDKKQGIALFLAMFIIMIVALGIVAGCEIGNMEGKETRFGVTSSATWSVFTTSASNGSVNSMHDSFTPIGGMILMVLMQLGEVVFGGVGCGLYGMIGFAILTVFISGLMVGRTPEYLGKKIEPFEMKMAVLICLATPISILVGSGLATALPSTVNSLTNSGTHGFSEVLYAYTSAGGNNGSAFAGFNANTVFINLSTGLIMLFARFVPMIATLAIANSLSQKKRIAVSAGTLATHNGLFVGLLIMIVLLVGALSFLPALAIGPIAEFFQTIGVN